MDFPYGNYGRVRIHHRKFCSDDSSPDGVTSEALCGTKGVKGRGDRKVSTVRVLIMER